VRRVPGAHGAELHRASDLARDQSYFLFATTQAELEFLRFPLGGLTKEEARTEARRLGVPVADKPDSQDICFVPSGSYARLVERLRPEAREPGEIVDRDGTVLGRHNGIALFTVGQRKGLGVPGGEPLYVLEIEPDRRRVVVGPRAALAETGVSLRELNWLAAPAVAGMAVTVKLRSTATPLPARLQPGAQPGEAELVLDTPAGAVAPGQAAVLYDGERMLGGGWIRRPT
jgi:tRNA-specific 2-thiouridylase